VSGCEETYVLTLLLSTTRIKGSKEEGKKRKNSMAGYTVEGEKVIKKFQNIK
jgi:hypothetical protein